MDSERLHMLPHGHRDATDTRAIAYPNSNALDGMEARAEEEKKEAGSCGTAGIETLACELLIAIACHLPAVDLARAASVCWRFCEAAMDEITWQHRTRTDHGHMMVLRHGPTPVDLNLAGRTWRWLYRACTPLGASPGAVRLGYSRDLMSVDARAEHQPICATSGLYAGEHAYDGQPHGVGIHIMVNGEGDHLWRFGSWTAGVLSGQCRIVQYTNGCQSDYRGAAESGLPHGHGEMIGDSGWRCVGEWARGTLNGHGAAYSDAGRLVYAGDYVDDRPCGRGQFICSDGSRVEGEFVDGKPHGHATCVTSDGTTFVGMYDNGERHGPGRLTSQMGDIVDGVWDRDDLKGDVRAQIDGCVFCGGWSEDGPHGRVQVTFGDGVSVQTGYWRDGSAYGMHTVRSIPACRGLAGHDHGHDALTCATFDYDGDVPVLRELLLPNGDRLSLYADGDGDDGDGDEPKLVLRYEVSDSHPHIAGCMLVCAGRHIHADVAKGFGVAQLDTPDSVLAAGLFASGWTCYGDALLRAAAPPGSDSSVHAPP